MATATRRALKVHHDGLFGERITRLRAQQGQTQEEVARLAGVAIRTYRGWEYGESVPRPGPRLRALAEALRVSPWFLLHGDDEEGHA